MILTDLNTEQNSYNDLNTFFALENINIAYIDIDFNRKEEVLGYFNPSESFRPGKPDLISKFLSLATFFFRHCDLVTWSFACLLSITDC